MLLTIILSLAVTGVMAEDGLFEYRFADAAEAAELLLSNRGYYENMSQNDLNFRMQKLDATLAELESFAAQQTMDFTGEEKAAIDEAMRLIESVCAERGYTLPPTDGIVFAKTTMAEECGAGAYTHGTQIYLGASLLQYGVSGLPMFRDAFNQTLIHEVFHCLTRNHPDFREAMYGILGFTVVEKDYDFPQEIRDRIISNPDVERHNSYASFDINGEKKNCAVIFTTGKPFEKPGDSFFSGMVTGLVPVGDLSVMYTAEDAANFWDVFGRNTDYIIDPEETLADNFSFTILYGPDSARFPTPSILREIDRCLREGFAGEADMA